MSLPMRAFSRDDAAEFMDFKNRAFELTSGEFAAIYARIMAITDLQRETDLNKRCINAIAESMIGSSVLEVGCGAGYLAGIIAEQHSVTACDIVLSPEIFDRYPKVTFGEANIEALPYDDRSFDTVVCTHTLEHVQHLQQAIAELRRVTRRRLIVVVPKERPYLYTFNLHIHFFPYRWSLQSVFGSIPNAVIRNLGDWFYAEDRTQVTQRRG